MTTKVGLLNGSLNSVVRLVQDSTRLSPYTTYDLTTALHMNARVVSCVSGEILRLAEREMVRNTRPMAMEMSFL